MTEEQALKLNPGDKIIEAYYGLVRVQELLYDYIAPGLFGVVVTPLCPLMQLLLVAQASAHTGCPAIYLNVLVECKDLEFIKKEKPGLMYHI